MGKIIQGNFLEPQSSFSVEKHIDDKFAEIRSNFEMERDVFMFHSQFDRLTQQVQSLIYQLIVVKTDKFNCVNEGYIRAFIDQEFKLKKYREKIFEILEDNFDVSKYNRENFEEPLKEELRKLDVA